MMEESFAFACPCGDPLMEPLFALLEDVLLRARQGELTHYESAELASGRLAVCLLKQTGSAPRNLHHAATLSRALYQSYVSWFLYSSEWLDALALLLRKCGRTRVLEVAAGCGVLAAPMRRRGLDWRTTDVHPARTGLPNEEPPEQLAALSALARHGDDTDVVFWAWWPREDTGDAALAAECARRRLPAIFVGDEHGCTGSNALWECDIQPLTEQSVAEDVDVPCWLGVRDRTWISDAALLSFIKS